MLTMTTPTWNFEEFECVGRWRGGRGERWWVRGGGL